MPLPRWSVRTNRSRARGALALLAGACALFASSAAEAAQPPRLIKDVKPGAGAGAVYDYMGGFDKTGRFFFIGDDGTTGPEPWVTNGTTAGTTLIANLVPGASGLSFPSFGVVNGNVLVGLANVSDSMPTAIVEPQVNEAFGRPHVNGNSAWFFSGAGNAASTRLWRTGGTAATTTMVKEFANTGSSLPVGNIVVNGSTAYFPERSTATGTELWKSDGTAAGTVPVADTVPGAGGLDPRELVAFGSGVLFTGTTPAGGKEIWKSDGTAAGTVQLLDIAPGATSGIEAFARFAVVGSRAYFTANDGSGAELWTTDGTTAGTTRLRATPSSPLAVPAGGVEFQGASWFTAFENGALGLYKTNGNAAGTTKVKALPSDQNVFDAMVVFDGALYFVTGGASGTLWRSDGTTVGTDVVAGAPKVTGSLYANASRLFFFGTTTTEGRELWILEASAPGKTPGTPPERDAGSSKPADDGASTPVAPGEDPPSETPTATSQGGAASGGCAIATHDSSAWSGALPLLVGLTLLRRRSRSVAQG